MSALANRSSKRFLASLSGKLFFAFVAAILFANCAGAQTVAFQDEYGKRVKASGSVSPLGSETFGEKVSLYNGQTEFTATDISIPGNNSLPVALGRRLDVSPREAGYEEFLGGFGEWDVEVPYLKVTALTGSKWGPNARCSSAAPPSLNGYSYTPDQIWNGINMHIPNGNGGELLVNNSSKMTKPTDGQTYPWVTKGLYQIRCLPTTANAYPGEGFLAVAPDGTKYYFDHGIDMQATHLGPKKFDFGSDLLSYYAPRVHVYLLATKIEDRFGNTVTYTYSGKKLTGISSSDGRSISLVYTGNNITSATAAGKTWQYQYVNGVSLKTIILPDNTTWNFAVSGSISTQPSEDDVVFEGPDDTCRVLPPEGGFFSISITHPSGAVGLFESAVAFHERNGTPDHCIYDANINSSHQRITPYFTNFALLKKTISAPGVAPNVTNYDYFAGGDLVQGPGYCIGCNSSKLVSVTDSTGEKTVYQFGITYSMNEGRLLSEEKYSAAGASVRKQSNTYIAEADVPSQLFPGVYGQSLLIDFDPNNTRVRPIRSEVVTQQGVSFNKQQNTFDKFANPTSVTKSSSLGYSRTDVVAYEHNLNKWVISQPTTVTNSNTGAEISKTDYDPITALPIRQYSFGQLDTTLTYFADGSLNTAKDALNRTTTLSNYYRGVPRSINFPDATSISATVNADGTIASTTDQLGSVTGYEYDLMGRMTKKNFPTGDTNPWVSMNYWFRKKSDGKWAYSTWNDRYANEIIVDDMWRPVLQTEWDFASPTATVRQTVWRYDVMGRVVFQSYPFRGVTDFSTLPGVHTEYDALGRVTKTIQDAENVPGLGQLSTTTEYLAGFQTRVTNPRGFATTTSYQVFDTPDTSRPEIIVAPEGQTTTILRNVYGNPLSVTRSGTWNSTALSTTRSYVYDAQQRLCKRIEPETGATVMDYDAVGNLAWSVQGSALTSNTCDRSSVAAADKTTRTYDLLNRIKITNVPGTANDPTYDYFADGALKSLINGSNRWDYTYNKLRLPINETLTMGSRVKTLTHTYNNYALETSLTYPSGLVVATAPNALNQPSQAGSFASAVTYFPNGGMSGFNYGNGIVHSMTQNTRLLPVRSKDMNGTTAILDDTYAFDANGNVIGIADGTAGAGGNRSMNYDTADRLIQTSAPNQWWITNIQSYDALDNIRVNTLGNRTHNYQYNATTKRLDSLTLPNASVARALTYDTLGNVTSNGAQSYVFDKANRLQSVTGKESYEYDGHGRRVKITRASDSKISYPMYSLEGKIIADEDQRSNKTNDYIYLNGSLVAKRSATIGSTTYTASYQHTDSLGSPVAESDAAKVVTKIERYTPYGEPSDNTYDQGPGFTGHVTDAATGLTYAQQRYYDPVIGRFLSVDPVETNPNNGASFNRYAYGNNNPYRFTDPDGRDPLEFLGGYLVGFGNEMAGGTLHDSYGVAGSAAEAGFEAGGTGGFVFDMLNPRGWAKAGLKTAVKNEVKQDVKRAGNKVAKTPSGKRVEDFTPKQLKGAKAENAAANGGTMACTDCSLPLESIANKKGVPTPANQAQVHHDPAISAGGTRETSKKVVVCPECHKKRHDN